MGCGISGMKQHIVTTVKSSRWFSSLRFAKSSRCATDPPLTGSGSILLVRNKIGYYRTRIKSVDAFKAIDLTRPNAKPVSVFEIQKDSTGGLSRNGLYMPHMILDEGFVYWDKGKKRWQSYKWLKEIPNPEL